MTRLRAFSRKSLINPMRTDEVLLYQVPDVCGIGLEDSDLFEDLILPNEFEFLQRLKFFLKKERTHKQLEKFVIDHKQILGLEGTKVKISTYHAGLVRREIKIGDLTILLGLQYSDLTFVMFLSNLQRSENLLYNCFEKPFNSYAVLS